MGKSTTSLASPNLTRRLRDARDPIPKCLARRCLACRAQRGRLGVLPVIFWSQHETTLPGYCLTLSESRPSCLALRVSDVHPLACRAIRARHGARQSLAKTLHLKRIEWRVRGRVRAAYKRQIAFAWRCGPIYSDQSPSRARPPEVPEIVKLKGTLALFSCFAAARAACVSTWLGEGDAPMRVWSFSKIQAPGA